MVIIIRIGDGMSDQIEKNNIMPGGQSEIDVDNIIAMLDGYTQSGGSRLKIDVVEGQGEMLSRQYHHGRCDVGSPWACGTPFDVLEE